MLLSCINKLKLQMQVSFVSKQYLHWHMCMLNWDIQMFRRLERQCRLLVGQSRKRELNPAPPALLVRPNSKKLSRILIEYLRQSLVSAGIETSPQLVIGREYHLQRSSCICSMSSVAVTMSQFLSDQGELY